MGGGGVEREEVEGRDRVREEWGAPVLPRRAVGFDVNAGFLDTSEARKAA